MNQEPIWELEWTPRRYEYHIYTDTHREAISQVGFSQSRDSESPKSKQSEQKLHRAWTWRKSSSWPGGRSKALNMCLHMVSIQQPSVRLLRLWICFSITAMLTLSSNKHKAYIHINKNKYIFLKINTLLDLALWYNFKQSSLAHHMLSIHSWLKRLRIYLLKFVH